MSEIKVNSVVNSTGDNDSGLDLSTNDQVIIKTANTTAITVDSSQNVALAGNLSVTGTATGVGKLLQVVIAHNSTEVETTTADTYVETGVTATITPTLSSSKILVTTTIQQFITASAGSTATRLLRGSTVIKDFGFQGYGSSLMFTSTNQYLDSPSTTSATTYKHQFKTNGVRTICQYQGAFGSTSTITLMEIAQ